MDNGTTLTLTATGDDIFAVVAILRQYFGLSLSDARAIVTALPATLPPLDQATASSLIENLSLVGATATDTPAAIPVPGSVSVDEPEYAPEYAPEPEPTYGGDVTVDYGPGRYIFSLESCGPSKLVVVKIIKECLGWGLKEAKELADEAPTTLELDVDNIDDLRAFVDDINGAGGCASFRIADD